MANFYYTSYKQKILLASLFFLLLYLSGIQVSWGQGQESWTEQKSGFTVASRGIAALDAVNENVAWAVAYNGTTGSTTSLNEFTRTTNGGTTWVKGTIGTEPNAVISNISALSATEAWAGLWGATATHKGIFHTTDGGVTWTKQATALYAGSSSYINWVSFLDANQGATGGDPVNGFFEVYTTVNGGQTWTLVPTANMPAALTEEYGLTDNFTRNGSNLWFGTTKGRLFRSTDNGLTWTVSAPFNENVTLTRMAFADNGSGIVAGVDRTNNNLMVNRTTNKGTDWTGARAQTLGGVSPNDIAYVPGTISTFVAVGSFSTFKGSSYSRDGGVSWTLIDQETHLDVDFVNATTGWSGAFTRANGDGGMFKFSGNLAQTVSGNPLNWTEKTNVFTTTNRGVRSLNVLNDNVVWAVPYNSTTPNTPMVEFVRTADGGATWVNGSLAGLPANAALSNISAVSALEAFATVNADAGIRGIYHTTNGGQSWVRQSATFANASSYVNSVTFSSATNGVALGDPADGYFEVYTTTTGGQTWTRVPQNNLPAVLANEYSLTNNFSRNGNTVWFGTTSGRVFKSTNNGLNWTVSAPFATNVSTTNTAFADNGTGIALGVENETNYMLISRTTDGGATWSTPEYQAPGGISANALVYVPGTTSTFVVSGSRLGWNGTAYTTNGGLTWTLLDQAVQHLEVAFSSPTNGWSGGFNKLFKFSGSFAGSLTGLRDEQLANAVQVYPNPATKEFSITSTSTTRNALVRLYNMNGQLILEQPLPTASKKLQVGHLPKGMYILHVIDQKKVGQQRVLIQ
ncbi:hypothetical protein TH61_05690 [Rufibacter sp. DG15C]|uniref:T9SS type A sorting domain-containing protein n=1 Tax=Rufibacter sp. DG15C TaxID=1379909 RepID=UPI00078BABEA|nr:T9SS type A sorting domain-containing protein [Rufibacter sp. DG15C]AMM50774.1 hypothetical protein TH61_05690 [Rufibacter sp. DG15C]